MHPTIPGARDGAQGGMQVSNLPTEPLPSLCCWKQEVGATVDVCAGPALLSPRAPFTSSRKGAFLACLLSTSAIKNALHFQDPDTFSMGLSSDGAGM